MGRPGYGKTAMRNDMYRMMDQQNKDRVKLESWADAAHTLSRLVLSSKYGSARILASQLLSVEWYHDTGPHTIVSGFPEFSDGAKTKRKEQACSK